MSQAALTLHFRNEETLRNLEQTAEALGISPDELAEAAIERELAAVGAGLEGKLAQVLDRLKAYGPQDLDRDIRAFAASEVEVEDPLAARRLHTPMVNGCASIPSPTVTDGQPASGRTGALSATTSRRFSG